MSGRFFVHKTPTHLAMQRGESIPAYRPPALPPLPLFATTPERIVAHVVDRGEIRLWGGA